MTRVFECQKNNKMSVHLCCCYYCRRCGCSPSHSIDRISGILAVWTVFFPYVGHPSSSTPTKERLLVCVGVAQLSAEWSCCCWSLSPKWTQSHCARILTRRELSSIRIFVKLVECFTYSGVHLAVTIKYSGSVNECYTAVFIVIHSELSFIRVDLWS